MTPSSAGGSCRHRRYGPSTGHPLAAPLLPLRTSPPRQACRHSHRRPQKHGRQSPVERVVDNGVRSPRVCANHQLPDVAGRSIRALSAADEAVAEFCLRVRMREARMRRRQFIGLLPPIPLCDRGSWSGFGLTTGTAYSPWARSAAHRPHSIWSTSSACPTTTPSARWPGPSRRVSRAVRATRGC
jgi:hypothetical protein